MANPLPPFTCTFSPNIPELLRQLKCSLIISTYQAGKAVIVSASDNDNLVQLPRNFERPMGISVQGDKMAIATKSDVVVLRRSESLAANFPDQPGKYDCLYVPRSSYYTGPLDLHDLAWGEKGLWAVNTKFSCLSLITEEYSFIPQWKPKFISALEPEDRCHMNGLTLRNGKPAYVTALGKSDKAGGWRENKASGGILMDVESGEVILEGLSMPHTPRLINNELYVLLSGTGELVKVDLKTQKYTVVNKFPGFVRGMTQVGDYLFVGLSKIRKSSNSFADLPISKQALFSGIIVLYIPMGSIVGNIKYETSVEEIYDVQALTGYHRPGILNTIGTNHKMAIETPETSFWALEAAKQ